MTMFYKVMGPEKQEDFVEADSALMAQVIGTVMFGPGVAVRKAFYGEWDCGNGCGYDLDGQHYSTSANKK
jgi:hypothetical protein